MIGDVNIDEFDTDPLGWSMRVLKHPFGEVSMAAVQANENMEGISELDIGDIALFVGIYDGQNGTFASEFLSDRLVSALLCESFSISFLFACLYVFYLVFFLLKI